MKRKWLFLSLKIVILSLLVAWLMPRYDLSQRFLVLLITSDAHPTKEAMNALFYASATKLLPSFVLILATPGVSPRRRILFIIAAMVLYLLLDSAMIATWKVAPFQKPDPTFTHIMVSQVWEMLGKWLLPFLLWFFAAWRQIMGTQSQVKT